MFTFDKNDQDVVSTQVAKLMFIYINNWNEDTHWSGQLRQYNDNIRPDI